jgi:hypothetical protein
VVEPAGPFVDAPLRELFPGLSALGEVRMRRAAAQLDAASPGSNNAAWDWYLDHVLPPPAPRPGMTHLVLSTSIGMFGTTVDWLELSVNVGWSDRPFLGVSAAVEVACWCAVDHNMHAVRNFEWLAGHADALVVAFESATESVVGWSSGPRDPNAWRTVAGLPQPPVETT